MSGKLSMGEVIGNRYEIRGGGVAAPAYVAYHAYDREAEVEVGFWAMRPELFPDAAARDGFVGAVVEMRGLRHPHLRVMFDAGHEGDRLYAATQLDTVDDRWPLPGSGRAVGDNDLLHYAIAVGDALETVHREHYLHGRLVATDVVHVAGLIKVGGVGLYQNVDRVAARSCWLAQERFLAPEVIGGAEPTPAADVFSLAHLIAELASGRSFEDSRKTCAYMAEHRPELASLVRSGLSAAPESRPLSVREFSDALRVVLVDDLIPTGEAAVLSAPEPVGKRRTFPGRGRDEGATLVDPPLVDSEEGLFGSPPARVGQANDTLADPPQPSLLDDSSDELAAVGAADFEATLDELPRGVRTRRGAEAAAAAVPPASAAPATASEPPPAAPPAPTLPPQTGGPVPIGTLPAPPPAEEATPVASAQSAPVFVSRKPKSEPGNRVPRTPHLPISDRPDMQPRLRSLSDSVALTKSAPPGTLGSYAPPRLGGAQPAPKDRRWLYIGLAIGGAILVAAASWLAVTMLAGSKPRGPEPDVAPPVPTLAGPTPVVGPADNPGSAGPCPADMVLVERAGQRFCVDRFESPGRDRMPETGVGIEQARASCKARKARLCSEAEWEQACRGEGDSSYPYGSSYRRELCNAADKKLGIAVAGAFAACRSAVGTYDMSGNVAEWVEEGMIKGGSALDRSDGRCSRKQRPRGEGGFSDVGFRCCRATPD